MTEQPIEVARSFRWYSRPVLFVSDIQRAIEFYVGKLGFEKKWHEADGEGTVCQVDRGGCEIILCEDTTRDARGRLFLELSREGVDQLLREVDERRVRPRTHGGGSTCFGFRTRTVTSFLFASRTSYQSTLDAASVSVRLPRNQRI